MARFNQTNAPKHHEGRAAHSICNREQVRLLEKTADYLRTGVRYHGVQPAEQTLVAEFDRLPNGDFRALVFRAYEVCGEKNLPADSFSNRKLDEITA